MSHDHDMRFKLNVKDEHIPFYLITENFLLLNYIFSIDVVRPIGNAIDD